MKTREEILKLWSDTELCEDFGPILEELLNDRDTLMLKIGEERREAFHAGYQSNKPNPALECQHRRTESIKTIKPPFQVIVCLDCGKEL